MTTDAMARPSFPPLLTGIAVPVPRDPFAQAVAEARAEAEPGRVYWSEDAATLRAAVVFAPQVPLAGAMAAVIAVKLGLSDSIGALAPPEVAVQFDWPDRIRVNGALCGGVRAAASTTDPAAEPDWLVVGIEVPILPLHGTEPGTRPDETTLLDEGCGDIPAAALIESWSRHTLVWINRLMDDGAARLIADWRGRCPAIGTEVALPEPGIFAGLDEAGGIVVHRDGAVRIVPLTVMLGERT